MTQRTDVTFSSGKSKHKAECAGWFYLPEKKDKKPPVIVMAHGLSGTKDMRLPAFAEVFSGAGYACLVFDYRHFGASGGEPRQLIDIDHQLEDWRAAIDYARTRGDQVDTHQVVLWGSSFSGGHVIKLGAEDSSIKAIISQCPFTNGIASASTLNPVTLTKVSAIAIADLTGALLGAKPITINAAGKPGEAVLMDAPDAESGMLKIVGPGSPWKNEVIARFVLQITRYFPGTKAKNLTMPALFCVCLPDSVAPSKQTLKHVSQAKKGTVNTYDFGHFDVYTGSGFDALSADQLAFLQAKVPVN